MAYYYNPDATSATASPQATAPTTKVLGIAPKWFGGNPQVNAPWNFPFTQMSSLLPSLPALNAQTEQNILSETRGELSPEEVGNIQDYQARFGISSGMPGSELATNLGARTVGSSTRALQQQGLSDYTRFIPSVFKTQMLDPDTQVNLAMWNATNKAKPDPFLQYILGGLEGGASAAMGGGM